MTVFFWTTKHTIKFIVLIITASNSKGIGLERNTRISNRVACTLTVLDTGLDTVGLWAIMCKLHI